ncbi:MAG: GDSL family lipase, partial [Bacteroidetes bacterium]|nr:GDSL family lipase [Bacteroidota bacterium]
PTLAANELKPFGRFAFDEHNNLELISSAAHFGFGFTGKECVIHAFLNDASGHNYLQYELDGGYQKRIRIGGGDSLQIPIDAGTNGRHTIWIYKTTEATTGPIFINRISGNDLYALTPPDVPLIEFIGNSITCGAAADSSEMPCSVGDYHDHHNAYYAYGPRVARALHANFLLSSVSGIGIYRTWNMDSPSMPMVYENKDFLEQSTRRWDFKTFTPEVVSIALGTNDLSHGDGVHPRLPFDSAVFVSKYISFVKLVKSKYPKAKIALLSSPMINGNERLLLQNCLSAIKKNIDAVYPSDHPVSLYFFEPMNAGGCLGHPSVEDHAILAQQLIPFFRKLLQ